MKTTKTTHGGTVEILAADKFVAVPVALTVAGEVLAGTPIKEDGSKSADGTDALGILLYDADADANPNVAVVVQGVIDQKKAEAHSGVTYNATALKTAVPGIVLRNNIGVNAD